ncbi:MAG TPA: cupin domain-containing protein [Gaiellaceae bacterium]|nr:cupin domain-containing protein [Gaiellaceae bacterium]
MVPEAPLERTEEGLQPTGPGWFVVNAREARWYELPGLGAYVPFEGPDARFDQLGMNINVLPPGDRGAMYHREPCQEGFLVLAGEPILIVDGQERRLRPWDYVHLPPDTSHVLVGAGDVPCVYVAVGTRPGGATYPVDAAALAHDAGVEVETSDAAEAYSRFGQGRWRAYREGDLPG